MPYENFIRYTNPIFSISTRLDVTELLRRCKAEGTSFFTDFMFLTMKCLNSVEELRIRIKGENVVVYDKIDPNYIVMSDGGVIVTCRSKMYDEYAEFYTAARSDVDAAKRGKNEIFNSSSDNDCFFISCMPWLDIASMSNPYDIKNAEQSSIPRLTWSKFTEENGRYKMMMDIAAHHALVDGEPVCRAFNLIQAALDDVEKIFG